MCYTHMQTRSGGRTPMPTHPYSTRSKDKAPTGTRIARPFVPPVDTDVFWPVGKNRPAFSPETEAAMYNNSQLIGGVNCYLCKTSSNTTMLLPKKGDAAGGDYATIGHIVQWQDYVAQKCDPKRGEWNGYEYEAYFKKDVVLWYNDVRNLELQSMSYNSSIAHNYDGTSPLTPTWVEE